MGIFSQKSSKGWNFGFKVSCSALLAALLFACGDDPVSGQKDDLKDDSSSSGKIDSLQSSSSSKTPSRSSSSSSKGKVSSSSSLKEVDPLDGQDIVYVLVNGSVSGSIALDGFASTAKVKMVQLDTSNSYKETKNVFSGKVGKDGSYGIDKIDLPQPYVIFSVDGKVDNIVDGKSASITLSALSDATSGEVFNLNLLTTLESERTLGLLSGRQKVSFEDAKKKASEDVWGVFHLDAADFDASELIHVSDLSESGAALLASTVLLQVGANGDFAKSFKAVAADVRKDGTWDDSDAKIAIADWALSNDLEDGYASVRKALEKKWSKTAEFEKFVRNFYLTELEFPKCDAESAGEIFFVKNKASKFYAASYSDVSKSSERFVCDEKSGWTSIPDSLKDFVGETTPGKDGEVRRGTFSGEFFTYDGSSKQWRKATAVEKDRYFVLNSDAKEFVDIQDVYESIKDDERVIFVLRHAERGDDTSKGGTLTDNGKKQSEEVGARLTKFKEDFVLGASEFLRAHQTVESIAKGRGQSYDKRDTIPQLNDDWYAKNNEAVEKAKNECGGGWEVTSKYAYTGAYSTGADAAYYNLAERSVELIEDVLVKKYPTEKFVLLSSHDKLMVPLVAYCSNLQVELKKYENNGKWINYLAGVAIIIDKDGNRRYVAIRGLKSGYAN